MLFEANNILCGLVVGHPIVDYFPEKLCVILYEKPLN